MKGWRVRLAAAAVAAAIIVVAACLAWRAVQGMGLGIVVDGDGIGDYPAQVLDAIEIGEWEFLSVEDEELVDTVRKGIFRDDRLARIYYGTLRLGFDLRRAPDGWISVTGDTVHARLPAIGLLDEGFLDEARTKAFIETGSWSDGDRARMYDVAYGRMIRRCLTAENIGRAEENAARQFTDMLKALGYANVRITFERHSE